MSNIDKSVVLLHSSNNNNSILNSSTTTNCSNENNILLNSSSNTISTNCSTIGNYLLLANNSSLLSSSASLSSSDLSSSVVHYFKSSKIEENRQFDTKNEIKLRFLFPSDIPELKNLCAEWFPVDYPDSWYTDITSSSRFYSLAATYNERIVGMIVAEIKTKKATDKEDWHILSRKHSDSSQVTYILSLGVFKDLRRLGIASLLLDTLLAFLKSETDCKAIYLHVLCSNQVAIKFYEKRNFQQRIYLPNYYTINGQLQDGYCYVLYMNNGQPPWTFTYPFIKISF